MSRLDIRHSNDPKEILRLADDGFEPVECSIGGESITGPLTMDHHGRLSHLEGVAVRAYRDHWGALEHAPRFVVTGAADADATFAIAALAGLLPRGRDLAGLADLVHRMDTAPIGVDLATETWGAVLLLWNALGASAPHDALAFFGGVARWRELLAARPGSLDPLLVATRETEAARIAEALAAPFDQVAPSVAVVVSPCWGFDVWYRRAPIVVALTPEARITVGVRDTATAERLLGPGGLKTVFPHLAPAGWGGRESIGGSPRGANMTRDEAVKAALVIAGMVKAGAVTP